MSRAHPSPLAVAVCDGDRARVEALLDAGAPIDRRDHKGRGPLVLALLSSELDIARLLLERGADPNLHDARGRTPLNLSLERRDEVLAGALLDAGARPDLPDHKVRTPLHLAAAAGFSPLVTRLLKQRARPDARDLYGGTPLHHAAKNGRLAAARALLRGEPNLEARDDHQCTPLHLAVERGAQRVIELLVAAGADTRAYAHGSVSPVSMAYAQQDYQAVELMEGPGARTRIEAGLATATEHRIPAAYCEALDERLETLGRSIGPITEEPRFDVNRFLEVFDLVRLKPGFVLDYYHEHLDRRGPPIGRRSPLKEFIRFDDEEDEDSPPPHPIRRLPDPDARPLVFTRAQDAPREEALEIACDLHDRRPHQLRHLSFERSPEGLLQWVVFRTAVTQFHLCWHANYNDRRFILTRASLERTLAELNPPKKEPPEPGTLGEYLEDLRPRPLPRLDRDRLRALDLAPWVKVAGNLGEVRVLTFSKWGGFTWRHHHLRWPHHVDRVEEEVAAAYDCGVMY